MNEVVRASWPTAAVQLMSDRHFDQLATRFAEKIYGGAKVRSAWPCCRPTWPKPAGPAAARAGHRRGPGPHVAVAGRARPSGDPGRTRRAHARRRPPALRRGRAERRSSRRPGKTCSASSPNPTTWCCAMPCSNGWPNPTRSCRCCTS
jgi:hypothetical protein